MQELPLTSKQIELKDGYEPFDKMQQFNKNNVIKK